MSTAAERSTSDPVDPGSRTSQPLRVLHVSQPTEYGVAECVSQLVDDQVARGWSVTVACPAEGALASSSVEVGARHQPWEAARSPTRGVGREVVRLRAIVRETSPDVIHLHSSKAGLIGRLTVRGRIPTFFHTQAWSFLALPQALRPLATGWERLAARWATATVCASEGEAAEGKAAGIGGLLIVVPNGVVVTPEPDGEEARRFARRELGLTDIIDGGLVVCVGRLSRQKGQDVLLAAWPRVRARAPKARLVLVGEGPDREHLEAMATDDVTFAGFRTDVRTWLRAANVAAFPSRWEGLPLTLLEAMAVGRSVVGTDIAGIAEVIAGQPAIGAVVPPDDHESLAEALIDRLVDPSLANEEGVAAHARARSHYSVERRVDTVAEMTVAALQGRPVAPSAGSSEAGQ